MMAFMNIEKKNQSNKFWLGVRVGEIRCLNFSGFFSNSGILDSNGFLKKKTVRNRLKGCVIQTFLHVTFQEAFCTSCTL